MDEDAHKKSRHADLDWVSDENTGTPAPRSVVFDDIYFSGDGPAETNHVFIDGNDLPRRFENVQRFAIGELGFGTGLNFLMAWRAWNTASKAPKARLHFFSIEKYPLADNDMARAHQSWPDLKTEAGKLRLHLPPPVTGFHRCRIAEDVFLTLFYGDVEDALSQLEGAFDVWFLDGFSPAKNPKMWRPELFQQIARLSRSKATVSTFTVAGDVRRGLSSAGFTLKKRPGFGRKREMLTAQLDMKPNFSSVRKPWFAASDPQTIEPGAKVAVIGAGIAGASLAHALRQYGLAPIVFETAEPGAGASGNPAGLIMPRLDLGDTSAARFFLQAYVQTIRLLTHLSAKAAEPFFNPCGALLGAEDKEGEARLQKVLEAELLPEGWIEKRDGYLFFPQAGVVDPRLYVSALLRETSVKGETLLAVDCKAGSSALRTDKAIYDEFDAVIIANGVDAARILQARTLPLTGMAGQLDYFPQRPAPDHAIVIGPYVARAIQGGLIAGATYEKLEAGKTPKISEQVSKENITAVIRIAPDLADNLDPTQSAPRVSVRCQTPDQLPVVGPVPDWGFYGGAYDGLRFGQQRDYLPGEMQPGVYMLTGLGSRGLVTAPLCADMIASTLSGAPSPVDLGVAEALHPARFFIRDLKKARSIKA